jgi:hypothetical protein
LPGENEPLKPGGHPFDSAINRRGLIQENSKKTTVLSPAGNRPHIPQFRAQTGTSIPMVALGWVRLNFVFGPSPNRLPPAFTTSALHRPSFVLSAFPISFPRARSFAGLK